MANPRFLTRAFSSGELTPEMFGRLDLAKYQAGLAICRNFETLPHGPARNRTGTEYVKEVKDSTKATRLIPFTYSNLQTFSIELGAGYFRFHTQGSTLLAGAFAAWSGATSYVLGDAVLSGGVNYYCVLAHTNRVPPDATFWAPMPADGTYEIPNGYAEADLFDIHYVQSADVMTLVHPNYPPAELRRIGATNWQLTPISFTASIAAPTGVGSVGSGGAAGTPIPHTYVVTSLSQQIGSEESVASSTTTTSIDLTVAGQSVIITWTGAAGASRYNIYKLSNGLYGYIGQAAGTSFVDNNIASDISNTPPLFDVTFASAGNYPGAVSYFEQRRIFAGTLSQPLNVWMTRSGTESNIGYTLPTRDDNAIRFRIAAREASTIRHIVPMSNLLLMTASCEFRVASATSDALTPTSVSVRPQSYSGANNVQPVVVNSTVLYAQSRGGRVREMAFNFQAQGFLSNDISILAPHLFDYARILDMAFARAPHPILWCISSTGDLLGMTYVPEQSIAAWHRHDTDGVFESCCVVTEGSEDMLYVIVRRTINGLQKRFVERKRSRNFATQADAFFVDCGSTYSGAPATVISGLDWLEGETVNVLADGAVHPQCEVTGGLIVLQHAASKVQVGLPITADLETLPLSYESTDGGQGRTKNVNKVWLRVVGSSGISAGPSFDKLTRFKQRATEPYDAPDALRDGEISIMLSSKWAEDGQVCIRQSDPLPLTIVSMVAEVSIGG